MNAEEFVKYAIGIIDKTIELNETEINNAKTPEEKAIANSSKSYLMCSKETINTIWNYAQKEESDKSQENPYQE